MTEYVFVKPNEGGRVRMPDRNSTVMPAEGQLVPRIDYYERLIIGGDLTIDEDRTKTENAALAEAQKNADVGRREEIAMTAGKADLKVDLRADATPQRAQAMDRPNDTQKRSR